MVLQMAKFHSFLYWVIFHSMYTCVCVCVCTKLNHCCTSETQYCKSAILLFKNDNWKNSAIWTLHSCQSGHNFTWLTLKFYHFTNMFDSLRFAFSTSLWGLHEIIKHKLVCLGMASRRHCMADSRKLVLKSLKIQNCFFKPN